MKLVGIQLDIIWENKQANFEKVRRLLDKEAINPGSLIVLPEMFSTGFSMNVDSISEKAEKETQSFIASLAEEYHCHVLGGVVTRSADGRGRNEAVVYDAGGTEVCRYCKIHPFSYAGENSYYNPGNRIQSFMWHDFKVSPLICYDLRFPEVFRAAVGCAVTLFVVIANWPSVRLSHWETLLKARAIENQAYVIGVNRCGTDPNVNYSGHSMILDPSGNPLTMVAEQEMVIQASVNYDSLADYRSRFPALADRRKDLVTLTDGE